MNPEAILPIQLMKGMAFFMFWWLLQRPTSRLHSRRF
jgi:hypothetical protein